MGGCKCTYKNCTVKSDGKTHLFHYPVFNKIRCHQWIINAQRYELLDLTVSQLKNRVICQYHFKDEDFMNCQKGKLTKDAVPTEDGPFCDTIKWNKEHNHASGLPLITEDIENEDLPYEERVKNYSIKYADFLTNFEPELLSGTNFDSFKLACKDNVKTDIIKYSDRLTFQSNTNLNSLNTESAVVNSYDNVEPDKEIKLQEIIIENNAVLSKDKTSLQGQFPVIEEMSSTLNNNSKEDWNESKIIKFPNVKNVTKESKVRILSEKKFRDAIKIPNNLQRISPSSVITLPRQKNKTKPINSNQQTSIVPYNINLRDNERNLMCPADFNIQKQEQPTYPLQTHYQTSENVQPTYSLDLNCLKYEQPTLYTLQVNQSLENHQPTTSFLNEEFQNIAQSTSLRDHNKVQPLYTIDTNGMKQTCLPSISLDTNEVKQETQTILDLVATDSKKPESMTNQQIMNNVLSNEKHSVIKLLDDKYTINVEFDPKEGTKSDKIPVQPNSKPKEPYIIKNKKDASLLKSRMSPNRLAKIEEKRTFNKKLVDACIELEKSFLQKSSPKRKITQLVKCNDQKEKEDNSKYTNKKNTTQVSSYLSEDPNLPSLQEYTLKFLEDRLQQMENRLLGKIDQNSQKIQELKELFKPPSEKKAASIQTNLDSNQGSYKRHLYKEISQFLSPICRSGVYEELFINKFSLNNKNEENNVSSEVKNKQRRFR